MTTATTANLGVTKLETNQAQKEATINEAFDAFDAAIGGRLSKSVAGGSNVELTTPEARNAVMEFTGALTGSINVDLPADVTKWRNRTFIVHNATTGSHTLTIRYEGGTGVSVPQGFAQKLYHNGTNVYPAGPAISPTTGLIYTPTLTWTNVAAFNNSWVNTGGIYEVASYSKDANGLVRLRGLIAAGTMNAVAFQLPAGFRPAKEEFFPVESAAAYGRVSVETDGDVIPRTPASNVAVWLSTIRFQAA